MAASSPAAMETFRDPWGSLRIENGRVLRKVKRDLAGPALAFLRSELAEKWVASGRLVSTTIVDEHIATQEMLLEHPRIFFTTYPWEWTPGQWVAAAGLTLDLCESLVEKGLILKDATPLNVLFESSRPVFVDVLSIEKRVEASPLWIAYGQFVRTFLLPLVAYKYLGWPLSACLQRRDGYEPSDLYPYLSHMQRWSRPVRSLVTLPYLLEKRGTAGSGRLELRQSPEIATAVLRRNLRRLRNMLAQLTPTEHKTRWSDYSHTAEHYSDADHGLKQSFVRRALATVKPENVLDLGANAGVYSRIAASCGANVIGWDTDIAASEQSWQVAVEQRLLVLPVLADPARPTPAAGWRNAESLPLLERARGRFDCVMMLGLIHHLLIADQIPLGQVVWLLRELTTRYAIAEWVPRTDPRFVDLVRGRDDLYSHLDETAFLDAIHAHFILVMREQLNNRRTLFLLKTR